MQSVTYPMTIRWNIKTPAFTSRLEVGQGEQYPLTGSGEVVLSGNSLTDAQQAYRQITLKLSPSDHGASSPELPASVTLAQNYPNPFNPTTNIKFELPMNSRVKLEVYNILGERIASVVDKEMSAGRYDVSFDGSRLSSGVYIYKLQVVNDAAGSITRIHRMLLVK
jgi:hypothetical protein